MTLVLMIRWLASSEPPLVRAATKEWLSGGFQMWLDDDRGLTPGLNRLSSLHQVGTVAKRVKKFLGSRGEYQPRLFSTHVVRHGRSHDAASALSRTGGNWGLCEARKPIPDSRRAHGRSGGAGDM
jgi:hypothetical protein